MPPSRASSSAAKRVRWERKLRTLMLCVLALIGWIGLKAMLALIATHSQAQQEMTLVSSLRQQNRALQRQQQQLNQRSTIINEARALGMVKVGEKPYVVTGLHGGQ
jgi:cell division protein FtsB